MTTSEPRLAFTILGRRLTAVGSGTDLAQWLAHHWRRSEHEVSPHPFEITLRCSRQATLPTELRARLPALHTSAGDAAASVHVTESGERASALLGSVPGGVYLELEPNGARLDAWGVTERGAAGRWPLLLALHEAVRASGLLPLHCAAAVHPDDRGATIFLGPAGVGKSTTLLTLARAGWAPVCEDFAWLDPESRRLYAWDHEVRLRPDALARFGPLATWAQSGGAATKRVVPFDEIAARCGVQRQTSASLQRLAWLQRDRGPSGWEPLDRVAAVPVLWEAIGLPLTEPARRLVASRIASVLGGTELRTLRLGATPLPTERPT